MAAVTSQASNLQGIVRSLRCFTNVKQPFRFIGTTARLCKEEDKREEVIPVPVKKGWFEKILNVRTIEPSKESHASKLSSKETLYELMFHAVKPEYMEEYLKQFQVYQELMQNKASNVTLKGSFTVEIGDQDEAVHIWEYKGGYPVLNEATQIYRTDKDFIAFRQARNKMLRSRKNQILLSFSFWPELIPRDGPNIYEMRSYTLRAGTMIEWANNWSRGLQYRKESNPVTGMFSQIGQLYQVHHIWCYKDLQMRKDNRESAWQKPGWDEVVQYTVPLIRHMESRILIPTPFSPLK
ncbi:protein NipSnap-like [Dreissena polymorpha]|uniref:protein NipSnap-like n=1 Tax=Dreissena polymorpha TaxID=45954 RepID=UPI00226409C5|nr:protein NipSnap-like [Dreissena polymorpha]